MPSENWRGKRSERKIFPSFFPLPPNAPYPYLLLLLFLPSRISAFEFATSLSLSLSFSISFTHSPSLTLSVSLTVTLSISLNSSLAFFHTYICTLSRCYFLSSSLHSQSLSLFQSHSLCHSLTFNNSHPCSYEQSLSFSLSLTHTHTLVHTHTHFSCLNAIRRVVRRSFVRSFVGSLFPFHSTESPLLLIPSSTFFFYKIHMSAYQGFGQA